MSDSLNFEQKIPISAMTEQRIHILVLKHHLLDMRRAARFQYSNLNQNTADIYKIVKKYIIVLYLLTIFPTLQVS